jgi:hypothetical protein
VAIPLRLGPHVKEFYFSFIGEDYPELLARYERAYPGTHAPPRYREKLSERVERIREQYGFGGERNRRRAPQPSLVQHRGQQLALPM